ARAPLGRAGVLHLAGPPGRLPHPGVPPAAPQRRLLGRRTAAARLVAAVAHKPEAQARNVLACASGLFPPDCRRPVSRGSRSQARSASEERPRLRFGLVSARSQSGLQLLVATSWQLPRGDVEEKCRAGLESLS